MSREDFDALEWEEKLELVAEHISGTLDEAEDWIFNASEGELMFACGVEF